MKLSGGQTERQLDLFTLEKDFSGGLNENLNRAPNQARFTHNVYVDEGGVLRPYPAFEQLYTTPLNFVVKRAFAYVDRTATQKVAMTDNVNVKITEDFSTYTDIPDPTVPANPLTLSPLYDTKMTSYLGFLIGTNGSNNVWRYDGSATIDETAAKKGRYILSYGDRVWILNDDFNPDGLYYSTIGLTGATSADRFPATNVFKITSRRSGRGTGLANCKHGLLIFKNDAVRLLTGTSEENFELIPLSDDIGCMNSDSLQEYGGYVIFLGYDGFYMTDGTGITVLPPNIPVSSKQITQVYDFKIYDMTIIGQMWNSHKDTGGSPLNYYYETTTKSPIFIADTMYSPDDTTMFALENNTFWDGSNHWTPSTVDANKQVWDFTSGTAAWVKNKNFPHLTASQGFCPIPRKINFQVIDTADNSVIHSSDYSWGIVGTGGSVSLTGGNTITVDSGTFNIAKKYCNAKVVFNIESFHALYHNPSTGGVAGSGWSNYARIESEPFILQVMSGRYMQFTYTYNVNYQDASEYGSGYYYMRVFNAQASITGVWGRARFTNLYWRSKEISVDQDAWGAIELDYNEHGGTWTKAFEMRFYNGATSTWSAWIACTDGAPPPDPHASGLTTAIQIQITANAASPFYMVKPFQMNYFKLFWYKSLVNFPKSRHNISSVMWKNKYLLAYTEAGDEYNRPIMMLDGSDQEIGFRYFKWEFRRAAFMLNWAHKTLVFQDSFSSNQTNVYAIKSEWEDRTAARLSPAAAEFEYFIDDGIFKNIKRITIMLDRDQRGVAPSPPIMPNQLKVEIYLKTGEEVETYAGDLDLWVDQSTPYEGQRFTYLNNVAGDAPLNHPISYTVGLPQPRFIPVNDPRQIPPFSGSITPATWTPFCEGRRMPIGWANSVIVRFIWCQWDLDVHIDHIFDLIGVRSIKIEYEVRDKDPNFNSDIRSGGL